MIDPDHHEAWHAWGVATVALLVALTSLFIAAGSCGQNDRNADKIDHLEQRLDNLRDAPR